jgi:hypothetical protein
LLNVYAPLLSVVVLPTLSVTVAADTGDMETESTTEPVIVPVGSATASKVATAPVHPVVAELNRAA